MVRTRPSPAWVSNVCAKQISLHCLFEGFAQKSWMLCADTTKLLLSVHWAKFQGTPLRNALQLRSWGSDAEVSATATLLQTTIVIYTTCTETIRRWLSYQPLFPVAATTKERERSAGENFVSTFFERLIRVLWLSHWSLFHVTKTAANINCQVT